MQELHAQLQQISYDIDQFNINVKYINNILYSRYLYRNELRNVFKIFSKKQKVVREQIMVMGQVNTQVMVVWLVWDFKCFRNVFNSIR